MLEVGEGGTCPSPNMFKCAGWGYLTKHFSGKGRGKVGRCPNMSKWGRGTFQNIHGGTCSNMSKWGCS